MCFSLVSLSLFLSLSISLSIFPLCVSHQWLTVQRLLPQQVLQPGFGLGAVHVAMQRKGDCCNAAVEVWLMTLLRNKRCAPHRVKGTNTENLVQADSAMWAGEGYYLPAYAVAVAKRQSKKRKLLEDPVWSYLFCIYFVVRLKDGHQC